MRIECVFNHSSVTWIPRVSGSAPSRQLVSVERVSGVTSSSTRPPQRRQLAEGRLAGSHEIEGGPDTDGDAPPAGHAIAAEIEAAGERLIAAQPHETVRADVVAYAAKVLRWKDKASPYSLAVRDTYRM